MPRGSCHRAFCYHKTIPIPIVGDRFPIPSFCIASLSHGRRNASPTGWIVGGSAVGDGFPVPLLCIALLSHGRRNTSPTEWIVGGRRRGRVSRPVLLHCVAVTREAERLPYGMGRGRFHRRGRVSRPVPLHCVAVTREAERLPYGIFRWFCEEWELRRIIPICAFSEAISSDFSQYIPIFPHNPADFGSRGHNRIVETPFLLWYFVIG